MPTQTPGGVHGSIINNRYGGGAAATHPQSQVAQQGRHTGGMNTGGGNIMITPGGGGRFNTTAVGGPEEFQRYEDEAYQAAQRRMDPRFAEQSRAATQQLINQGVDPTSEAGRRYLEQISDQQNRGYQDAAYGAMGEGRAAQQQAFGQANANDQLTLQDLMNQRSTGAQLQAANIGAGASMYNSDNALQGSMYGHDTSRYLGELGNQLGFAGLNEQGRQFDVNDVFRSGTQDLQMLQSLFGMGMGMDQNAQQTFDQNAGYGNNWWNQVGSMLQQATGGIFTPVDVVGSANAQTGAGSAQDQFGLGLLGAMGGIPS